MPVLQYPIRYPKKKISDIRSIMLSNFGEPKQHLLTSSSSTTSINLTFLVVLETGLAPSAFSPMFNIAMKWLQMLSTPIPETKSAEHDYIAKDTRVTVAAEKCPILNMDFKYWTNYWGFNRSHIDYVYTLKIHKILCQWHEWCCHRKMKNEMDIFLSTK